MRRLLLVLVVGACGDNDPQLPIAALQDPTTCMQCHPKHYTQWSGSMHAYASDDPVFVAMNARGQRETGGALGTFCVKCHAPMAVALKLTDGTGFDPAQLPPAARGITCYFCHDVARVAGKHDNGLVLANDATMRGGATRPGHSPAHDSTYDPLMDSDINDSSMCGSCHDIVTPSGVALERTYQEWLTTIYTLPDQQHHRSCGACHMVSSKDLIADGPGLDVRERDNGFHDHTLAAIDSALSPFPDVAVQATELAAILDPAVAIAGPTPITGITHRFGGICLDPPGDLKVRIDAVGPGHAFPSGAAQDRRAWLEVIAYNASNAIVYSSGVVPDGADPEDVADPDLFGMWDRTTKADGTPAHFFWEVAHVDSQLLEPPVTIDRNDPRFDHSSTPVFSIAPVVAQQIDHITARLRIRAFPYAVLDDLVASGDLDPAVVARVQTIEMPDTLATWSRATSGSGNAMFTNCSPH